LTSKRALFRAMLIVLFLSHVGSPRVYKVAHEMIQCFN
jgi:hypothetical protein